MKPVRILVLAMCTLLVVPAIVHALDKGTARLVSVTPINGGCIAGPNGNTVQAWDIEPGFTYRLRLEDVTECANNGTDPALDIRINSSIPGHEYTDLVATNVAPGVYEFDFTLPANAWCTLPILYCTTPGEWLTTGLFVRRDDGATNNNGQPFTSHLRASFWGPGCTDPEMIPGPECGALPVESSNWGTIKANYDE